MSFSLYILISVLSPPQTSSQTFGMALILSPPRLIKHSDSDLADFQHVLGVVLCPTQAGAVKLAVKVQKLIIWTQCLSL